MSPTTSPSGWAASSSRRMRSRGSAPIAENMSAQRATLSGLGSIFLLYSNHGSVSTPALQCVGGSFAAVRRLMPAAARLLRLENSAEDVGRGPGGALRPRRSAIRAAGHAAEIRQEHGFRRRARDPERNAAVRRASGDRSQRVADRARHAVAAEFGNQAAVELAGGAYGTMARHRAHGGHDQIQVLQLRAVGRNPQHRAQGLNLGIRTVLAQAGERSQRAQLSAEIEAGELGVREI